jgi:hypothetical protein
MLIPCTRAGALPTNGRRPARLSHSVSRQKGVMPPCESRFCGRRAGAAHMGHSAFCDRATGGACRALVRLAPCAVRVVKQSRRVFPFPEDNMKSGLNDNQKQHLLATFGYVDRLLNDALQSLSSAGAPSPFQQCMPDSLPIQREVLADHLMRLRALMVRTLEKQGITPPKPEVSSLWSFKTKLMSAAMAIEELRPESMQGYGDLTDEATRDLEAVADQIADILDLMGGYLNRGTAPDLQARLERLEKITRAVE